MAKWYYAPGRWHDSGAFGYEPVYIPCEIVRVGRKRVRIRPERRYAEQWVYPDKVRDMDDKPFKIGISS